jgi:hypothetical protein
MENMTDEEHETRAMLLGMQYDADLNTYERDGPEHGSFDAVTLEVLDNDEWFRRWQEYIARTNLMLDP